VNRSSSQRAALIAALVIIVIWGANFTVQRSLFPVMGPAGFLFLRYLVMPIAAIALLLWTFGLRWPKVSRPDALRLIWLGILGHAMHVSIVTYGISLSTAFSSSLILACGPVFTLLILRWQGVERLQAFQLGGVAVACLGVLVFLSEKLLGARWEATGGDLLLLFAASLFSYYTVASKPLIERNGGVTVLCYAIIAPSPLIVLACAHQAAQVDWSMVGIWGWAAVLWATLVSAFVGWWVWGWVNAVRGVARTAPLMYLMPPVAAVFAWWLDGETFTWVKLAGAAITLGGVALAQFGGGRPRPAEAVID
jgi:drug/metabolite transporter (DMT)-like permease